MDPGVSINVEKLFIVLSFHVHSPRFFFFFSLIKSSYAKPLLLK